jgi:hypothetical protein
MALKRVGVGGDGLVGVAGLRRPVRGRVGSTVLGVRVVVDAGRVARRFGRLVR